MVENASSMWETIDTEEETGSASPQSLMSSEFCACGCGKPAVEEARMHAVLLRVARESLRKLEAKAKSGGERTRQAERLLWAWNRCEEGFDAFVHGAPIWECGPPTPLWLNSWCRRVEQL